MSVTIRSCETMAAPPRLVWADIERLETHPEWMADAVKVAFRTEQRRGVGTEFTCLTRIGPLWNNDLLRVTEWEAERVLGIEHTGSVKGVARFTLRPEGPGTSFCWEEQVRFPWWMGGPVGERVARPVLRRIWRRNLARLKDRFEAPPPRSASGP